MAMMNIHFDKDAANAATYIGETPGSDGAATFTYNLKGAKVEIGNGLTLKDVINQAVAVQIEWDDDPGPQFVAQPGRRTQKIQVYHLASGPTGRRTLTQVVAEATGA